MNIFENKIIKYDIKEANQFQVNPLNFRKHPQKQRDAVKASLSEIGWISTVVENIQTGNLIDGHERVWQALSQGESTQVPYLLVDLTPEEEKLALAVYDKITNMADIDSDVLEQLMYDVNTSEIALQELLAEMSEEAGIGFGEDNSGDDTEPEIDIADELRDKWGVELGQLWKLGEHRIICGDCTDRDVVARLTCGELIDMCHTDPPYNVDYGSSKNPRHKIRKIENDALSNDDWYRFVIDFGSIIKENTIGDCYVWGASGPDGMKMRLWLCEDLGMHWSSTIVWKKQQLVLSPAKYQRMYEPCLYGWFGEKSSFTADRKQTEVWEVDRPHNSKLHPTMKPIELCEMAIRNSSNNGGTVLELFSGSGSTLIACENLGRKCYAIELDPKYVAVALERYYKHTGIEPVLLD